MKKRMTVAVEGVNVNNVVIMPGALKCDEEVPVVWNGEYGDPGKLLGIARHLERNGNDVTMEIELKDDISLDLDDVDAFVYVQPFEGNEHPKMPGALKDVTFGRIRAVNLHIDPANPE